jgi:hypothetical protein
MDKKNKGQFYTVNNEYILEGFSIPSNVRIVEPFAGKGDLLEWIEQNSNNSIESYDIDPKLDHIIKRDTLMNPPNYEDSWIVTNPPYLARNKSSSKEVFDKYDTNDLYKCFLYSIIGCRGGIIIIPAGFFLSPRDIDVQCRNEFLSKYRILKVRYFEETVFPDTTTTVVAFSFERSNQEEQIVEWVSLPSQESKTFTMSSKNDWIIGGEIYKLPTDSSVKIRRHVSGQPLKDGEQQTFITLNALDSGKQYGRICLEYKGGYVYPAKESSRTYATLCIRGKMLSTQEQITLCSEFNTFIEEKRSETWSLFLPQFRESKEYARKRIPFELVYIIVNYLLTQVK